MTNQSFVKVTILLLYLQSTTSNSAKSSSSPVHEVINERIDDKPVFTAPSNLPYGNPLAGNSQQNARLHAQNQQAMFNAERVRQHKAQILRWTKTPPQVDSYMKAYQESQENHQLALEQQQINQRDQRPNTNAPKARGTRPESFGVTVPMKMRVTRPNMPITVTAPTTRLEPPTTVSSIPKRIRITRPIGRNINRNPKVMPSPEPMKITKADAIITERNRNHRSHGSNDYHQYLQQKRYQTVYVSPGPTYDQGVTIKPNGSPGQAEPQDIQEDHQLYTEAVPSKTQYVYPKQYNQMQHYESMQNIDTLNSLLQKSPSDQASELNALINSGQNHEEHNDVLNTPIDLYFYLKDPSIQTLTQHYDQGSYAQLPHSVETYAHAYSEENTENNDIKPTKEEIDDVEDPNKNSKAPHYGFQTEPPVPDTTTTKSNNYYKVEVASQTISAGHKKLRPQYHYKDLKTLKYYNKEEENSPSHQSLQYAAQPLALHYNIQEHEPEQTSDTSDSSFYSHQNPQPQGVQHLTEDGTGVSAYGEDNLHYAASYEFGYRVRDSHSGNDYGHREAKQDGETRGQYYVLLPDGRMQNVKYSAGPEGFHADISYDHLQ